MSHTQVIKTKITNLPALLAACTKCGATCSNTSDSDRHQVILRGADSRLARFYIAVNLSTGDLRTDSDYVKYDESHERLLPKFLMRYGVEVSRLAAEARDLVCREVILEDGRIRLDIELPEARQQLAVSL